MSRAGTHEPIVVVLAADANFCKQLAVMVASISRVTEGRMHHVFVLHDGYDGRLRSQIGDLAGPEVELDWIAAHSAELDRVIPAGRLPASALYRLRIEELLPPAVDRVLYLDTDMLVRRPLAPLWATDLGEAPVAAVQDSGMAFTVHLPWRELEISPRLPYFNSGVLVIPLGRWRDEGVSERALGMVARFGFSDADQGALNALFAGHWRALDPKWNVQTHHLWAGDDDEMRAMVDPELLDAAIRDPAIVHFCLGMWKRPWQPESRHRFRGEWFEVLDSTAWSGWRPDEPGMLFKLRRRARRARNELFRPPARVSEAPGGP
jgi:lipopolysaccharide biosynthesis glycosyltransferase